MNNTDYILDRQLVFIVKDICHSQNITIKSYSNDWIFVLEKDNKKAMICGFKFGLNDSASVAISRDKVGTYELLSDALIKAVPHVLVSTHASSHKGWMDLAASWGTFLIKPTEGMGGRDIYLFDEVKKAQTVMHKLPEKSWCVSPYLNIIKETRVILLDDQLLMAFEKHNPTSIHGIPMFNLRLGAHAHNIVPDIDILTVARETQKTLGCRLAAVDIVELKSGEYIVLEVNDGFSLEHYMRQSNENLKLGKILYQKIITTMMNEPQKKY